MNQFWLGVVISVVLGLAINEVCDVSPWLAQKLVRRAAHLWAPRDVDRATELAAEWAALVDDAPGKLTKLGHALRFTGGAVWRFQCHRIVRWVSAAQAAYHIFAFVQLTDHLAVSEEAPASGSPAAEPVDVESSLRAFGYEARMLRQETGMTYTEIANRSFYSKSAMSAVDQGHRLPTRQALVAFVTACGGDLDAWVARHAHIAKQLAAVRQTPGKPSQRALGLPPPDPTLSTNAMEYADALRQLREWSGMTYREIEHATRNYPRHLGPAVLVGALNRGRLPSRDVMHSFLRALDLDEAVEREWLTIWQTFKTPIRLYRPRVRVRVGRCR